MLHQKLAALVRQGETVAAALRRTSAGSKGAKGKRAKSEATSTESAEEQAARKLAFEELTDAADKLLRAGAFDIYSETRESLQKIIDQMATDQQAAADTAATAAGISDDVHQAATASGFMYDSTSGVYYNSSNGLYFDPRTSLYWPASGGDTYYYYDSTAQQFVPYQGAVDSQSTAGGADLEEQNQEQGEQGE